MIKLVDQINRLDFRAEIYLNATTLLNDGNDLAQDTDGITRENSIPTKKHLKKKILSLSPDILVLVDFNSLNQKLAVFSKRKGIGSCLLLLTTSNKKKTHKKFNEFGRYFDKVLCTFPSDTDDLDSDGKVEYVGNPLLDMVKDYAFENGVSLDGSSANVAVILDSTISGRLSNDIQRIVCTSLEIKFHISAHGKALHRMPKLSNVEFHNGKTYDLLKHCNAAITSFGVPSLEAVFLNCPQVVMGESASKFGFFKKSKQVSLINSIAGKQVVKEIQGDPTGVLEEVGLILNDQTVLRNNARRVSGNQK